MQQRFLLYYVISIAISVIVAGSSHVQTATIQQDVAATTVPATTTLNLVDESSSTPTTPTNSNQTRTRQNLLFEQMLSQDLSGMDEVLVNCVVVLKSRGAHRCWHKHSTFLDHLLGVHHILRLWQQGPTIGRVGLFHSAYSNSYVNLALFQPDIAKERQLMQSLIGNQAEELVYLFCIINRQDVVVNTLLKQGYIPDEGLHVPHLRSIDKTVYLDVNTLRMLVIFTMADTTDQYFGWQDALFGGDDHSMLLPGMDAAEAHDPTAIWPGLSKPGLWMSYVSQLGRVARTIRRRNENDDATAVAVVDDDDSACHASNECVSAAATTTGTTEETKGNLPPVFDHCTKVLQRNDEIMARDLYWSVMTGQVQDYEQVLDTLQRCIQYNPFVFEPHVVLAQKLLLPQPQQHQQPDFAAVRRTAERALELQQQWGTAWDKRLSFPAWVAWTRVLHQRAVDQLAWPTNSWDVNNFGLVRE